MLPCNAKTHEEFLYYAKKYFWGKTGGFPELGNEALITANWLYKLGRDLNLLPLDYKQFRLILENKHSDYYDGIKNKPSKYWRKRGKRSYFIFWSPESYRVMSSFKYSGQKKKRTKDNTWREYKKINKDKSKAGRHYNSMKKNLKFFCARNHRRLEKQLIHKERYDDLHRLTYKWSENPWNWD